MLTRNRLMSCSLAYATQMWSPRCIGSLILRSHDFHLACEVGGSDETTLLVSTKHVADLSVAHR